MNNKNAFNPAQKLPFSRDGRPPLYTTTATSKKMPEPARQDDGLPPPPSPRDTRIPRRRRHESITEAFKKAKEEYGIFDGSPSPAPKQWRNSEGGGGGAAAIMPDLVPGIQDMPLPSVEQAPRPAIPIGPPEEDFVWDIENDFTAGDLQVSDSPRIKVDMNRPFAHRPSLVAGAKLPATKRPPWGSNFYKGPITRSNSKMDEILAREMQHMSMNEADRSKPRPKNAKIDEIRQREAKMLSKRAYAAGRLEEIHEQNFDSRSVSPLETSAPKPTSAGEKMPNMPVTVFRGAAQDGRAASRRAPVDDDANGEGDDKPGDARDLLRRLARATSASPGPDTEQAQRKPRDQGAKPKVVAFTGLRRVDSTESAKSKASLRSDADPTDRIDAEIRLFAPQENQSEQGSVRAPSPPSNEETAKTPTQQQQQQQEQQARDMMLEMPRVTGAFVETPATRRRRGSDTDADGRPATRARTRESDTASDPGTSDGHVAAREPTLKKRHRARSLPRRRLPIRNSAKPPSVREDLLELQRTHNIDDSTLEDIDKAAAAPAATDDSSTTATVTTKRRSEPVRPPQLKAQPPKQAKENAVEADEGRSVLGRLLLSTLESTKAVRKGIDRLIVASASSMTRRVEAVGGDGQAATGEEEHKSMPAKSEQDNNGFFHLTTATGKDGSNSPGMATIILDRCPSCQAHLPPSARQESASSSPVTYLQVPVPRLYQTMPRFRLTLAGLLLFFLFLWLAAESTMCGLYCRPKRCSAGSECVFSLDDPHFGTALPTKLDQWTTGGLGGRILATAAEETVDRLADLQDLATGRETLLEAGDQELSLLGMSARQKRRLRRRLAKRGLGSPFATSKSKSQWDEAEEPSAEQLAKWEAWRRVRAERKRARRMGGTSLGDDERVEEE
ncbi:hypothetical protein L249_8724 [Ophiocordyceps polyrhachis-furcata BCC 54312]|uniref:Uncharacterized protein n=1 Tax=Ophiocordyceps polyrhachis-furcata BCC 54312 TaxID=1330021 RepID=A0A367L720_9HYPO|nr:hypothetical protein L249_8724 [Ophiocordyceps polyrhachis-furcata BCC 54312]